MPNSISLLARQQDRFPFLSTDCKRFCKPLFGNTRASCLAFFSTSSFTPLPIHPKSSFPSLFLLVMREIYQSATFVSCTRRMGREGVWDMVLEGVNSHHQMALSSPGNYTAGPAHQMQGAPSFPHVFLLHPRQTQVPSTRVQGPINQLEFILNSKRRKELFCLYRCQEYANQQCNSERDSCNNSCLLKRWLKICSLIAEV